MNRYVDALERIVWTAVEGFCAEWLVTQSLDAWSLKIAGVAGLASAAKCIVAMRMGDSNSAAAIPGVQGKAEAVDRHPAAFTEPEAVPFAQQARNLPPRKKPAAKKAQPAKKAAKKRS